MSNIFILDDDQNPDGSAAFIRIPFFQQKLIGHTLFIARSAYEATVRVLPKIIEQNIKLDYIFLDHDLGGKQMVSSEEENTGMIVAKYIFDHPELCSDKIEIVIHTCNPYGADNIYQLLIQKYPCVIKMPFPQLRWNLKVGE